MDQESTNYSQKNEYIYSVIRNDSFKMPDYGTEKSLFCRVKIIVGFSNKLIKRI